MKRRIVIAVVAVAILALVGTLVYAQGRGPGPGCCGMMKQAGQGPGPMAGQGAGACPMMGAGKMANTQPLTEAQKAFVEKVRGLHDQIRTRQAEINTLRARNGNREQIAGLEKEVQGLRTELHDVMVKNRELRMQIGSGMGPCCQKMANCPMYKEGKCPGPNAACCANCPLKDMCMAQGKQAGAQVCPLQPGKTCPMSKTCPLAQPATTK